MPETPPELETYEVSERAVDTVDEPSERRTSEGLGLSILKKNERYIIIVINQII